MFRFIHAADIHLDSPLKKLEQYEGVPVEKLRRATRKALKNMVDLAIDARVAFVCISGDLYDGDWKDYNTGLFFVSQMSRLAGAGIRFFLISGNHDAANAMTRNLRLPDNGHPFPTDKPATVVLDDLRVAVHGQGYDRPAVTENLALGYPGPVAGYFN
ncbi:MAG: metallophosphoesterase family protein, partial [Desulfohalobiaceae bacterium]